MLNILNKTPKLVKKKSPSHVQSLEESYLKHLHLTHSTYAEKHICHSQASGCKWGVSFREQMEC